MLFMSGTLIDSAIGRRVYSQLPLMTLNAAKTSVRASQRFRKSRSFGGVLCSAGIPRIAVFTAASETFNRKNINMSIDESIERFAVKLAQGTQGALIQVVEFPHPVLGDSTVGFPGFVGVAELAEEELINLWARCFIVSLRGLRRQGLAELVGRYGHNPGKVPEPTGRC